MFVIELVSEQITPDRTVTTWYAGKGKYRNSFSTTTEKKGAKLFASKELAEERIASADFQYRLSSENATLKKLNMKLFNPQIRKL